MKDAAVRKRCLNYAFNLEKHEPQRTQGTRRSRG